MKKIILIILPLIFLSSCLVVKYDKKELEAPKKIELSPKPQITMSDQVIRSDFGDMIAFLPEDWFFVNLEDSRENVFSTGVNPDYSLSLVFDELTKTDDLKRVIKNKNYTELGKISLDDQKNRSKAKLELVNIFKEINIGELSFMTYYTTTTSGALISRSAVFITDFGNCYRVSLIPMDILGKPIPSNDQLDIIFESILTTVKY
jgi:hypothetical protein